MSPRFTITAGLCLLLGLVCVGTAASATPDAPSRYEIEMTLDPEARTLTGTERVDYVNDTGGPLSEVPFLLIGNLGREPNPYLHPAIQDVQYPEGFDPSWTEIRAVRDAEGADLAYRLASAPEVVTTYSLEDGLLWIELPASLAPGERVTLSVDFATKFSAGLIMDQCLYRDVFVWRFAWNPVAIPQQATSQSRFELPAAEYVVELNVPEGWVVAGGADIQERTEHEDGSTTVRLENEDAVRSIPLVIGKTLERYTLSSSQGIVIDTYALPGAESTNRWLATLAVDILEYFVERFGPAPSRRIVVVENPVPGFYGMAANGLVLVGTHAYRYKDIPAEGVLDRFVEYLLAHELAHLWWGIGVGTDFAAENWLSEGFAEYLSHTYFEDKYGALEPNLFAHVRDGVVEDVLHQELGWWNLRHEFAERGYLSLLRNRFDEPIVRAPADVEYLNGRTVRTYNKGYLVLRALDGVLGHDVSLEALREAYVRYHREILTVEGFRAVVEEVSERDLEWFFESWLYGDDIFDAGVERIETHEEADGWRSVVHLRRKGEAELPVAIEATMEDGEVLEAVWDAAEGTGSVTFASASPIETVALDPQELNLDANRFDNHYPRRVILQHPMREDEEPVGRPLDAYVISVTPLGVSGSFRDDHLWGLTVAPNPTVPEWLETLDDIEWRWDVAGYLAANLDRGQTLAGTVLVSGFAPETWTGFLDAAVSYDLSCFEHPSIGQPGRFWWPANRLRVTLGGLGDLRAVVPYAGLTYARNDLLSSYLTHALTLRCGWAPGNASLFGTLSWHGIKRIRLLPSLYVDASITVGTGLFGPVPTSFQPSLSSLNAFTEDFVGDRSGLIRLDLRLPPLMDDIGFAIFNLARLDRLQMALYVQAGHSWRPGEDLLLVDPKVEIGVRFECTVRTLLGTPLMVAAGYAYPILGAGPDAIGKVFWDFSLPF